MAIQVIAIAIIFFPFGKLYEIHFVIEPSGKVQLLITSAIYHVDLDLLKDL